MRVRARAAVPASVLLAAVLAGCGTNSTAAPSASPAPPSESHAAASETAGGSTYASLSALEAALAATRRGCADPQAASTAGIKGALSSATCYAIRNAGSPRDTRLIIFDSHSDALAWQAQMVAGKWEADYVVGGNWGVAGPAVWAMIATAQLGGVGLSPTASPGFSTDAAPP